MDDLSKGLIPSEDELNEIIAQMMQTNPMQIPVVLLQLEIRRLILKTIDKLRAELAESIRCLEDEIAKK